MVLVDTDVHAAVALNDEALIHIWSHLFIQSQSRLSLEPGSSRRYGFVRLLILNAVISVAKFLAQFLFASPITVELLLISFRIRIEILLVILQW